MKNSSKVYKPELERIYKLFDATIKLLKEYIELSYSNYKISGQSTNGLDKIESRLASFLFGLKTEIEGKSTFFCDEIKQELYRWLDAEKIDVNNCPERLKHFLFEFNEILERRGSKIEEDAMNRKNEIDPSKEVFKELFSTIQNPLEKERKIHKNLKDEIFENSFGSSSKKAEQFFKQMEGNHDYRDFYFFPKREWSPPHRDDYCLIAKIEDFDSQQMINIQTVHDVNNNPQNWRLDEIPTEFDSFGRKKREFILISNKNQLYRWGNFNAQQRFEIKKALNISVDYLTDEEIKWVFREVKHNPSIWQFKEIDGQVYLVHNYAQIKREEIGTLIHNQKKFSEAEIEEINKSLNSYQEQKHLSSLIEQRKETKDKIPGTIEEVIRFKTWWSDYNVATVINYHESYYWVFLIVYDKEKTNNTKEINWNREVLVFPPNPTSSKWGEHNRQQHSSLTAAQSEASWLRGSLDGENPILYVHHNCNSYEYFSNIVTNPYVKKEYLPRWTSEPDKYLRSLDIVKVKNEKFGDYFYHVGVYVGNSYVCHYTKDKKNTTIDSWSYFLEGSNGEIIRYHLTIPFKKYNKIVKHIAITEATNYRRGNYELANRNCEHLANMLVYGINYSEQIQGRREDIIARNVIDTIRAGFVFAPFANEYSINNGKGETIKLANEINQTDEELERFFSEVESFSPELSTNFISLFLGTEIGNNLERGFSWYKEKILSEVESRTKEIEARIEIFPKHECVIM